MLFRGSGHKKSGGGLLSAFTEEAATAEALGPGLGMVPNTRDLQVRVGQEQKVREAAGRWDSGARMPQGRASAGTRTGGEGGLDPQPRTQRQDSLSRKEHKPPFLPSGHLRSTPFSVSPRPRSVAVPPAALLHHQLLPYRGQWRQWQEGPTSQSQRKVNPAQTRGLQDHREHVPPGTGPLPKQSRTAPPCRR